MSSESPEDPPVPSPDMELPPVTPPSAGFIIQLFLIPALIVAAVIGVWALFSQLAGSEVDIDRLVRELGVNNKHRRWRAAQNLSQVLLNERIAAPEGRELLSERPDVAEALAGLLTESLDREAPDDEDEEVKRQEFLARTMGSLKVDDVVLPVLARAIAPGEDTGVRRSGLMSLVLIAGRRFSVETSQDLDTGNSATIDLTPISDDVLLPLPSPTITDEAILEQVKYAAQDADAGIRHLAAYVLGLISGPDSIEQLKVLLLDADTMTQANAAIALSRNADPAGIPVIARLLSAATNDMSAEEFAALSKEDQEEELARKLFEQSATLVNCMTALGRMWTRVPESDRLAVQATVDDLASSHRSAGVRLHASALLREIQGSTE